MASLDLKNRLNLRLIMDLDEAMRPGIDLLQRYRHNFHAHPTFIPLFLTGGIGDVIMSIDFIRFLASKYQIMVYTNHLEAFKYFCPEIDVIKGEPGFSWRLEIDTVSVFRFTESFDGFLIKEHQELFQRQQLMFKADQQLASFNFKNRHKFYLIAHYAKELNLDRRQFPMHHLGFSHVLGFETKPRRQWPERYITIHDGFDVQNAAVVSGRCTKTWYLGYWSQLIKEIKKQYGIKVIQLGAATANKIDGVDHCLINKTTLSEAFDILAGSELHIDGDSGLVHAATRMEVPCVVMWGPTPHEFYGYPQNANITSSVCRGGCYGVADNWMDKCPIGFKTPKCMDEIKPWMIMDEIKKAPI